MRERLKSHKLSRSNEDGSREDKTKRKPKAEGAG